MYPIWYDIDHFPTVLSYVTSGGSDNDLLLYFENGALVVARKKVIIEYVI